MLTLVTGVGAKGQVGEAVATSLARRGDTVILVSRSAAEVAARVEEIVSTGARASGYGCDLANAEEVRRLADRVSADHGDRLDALVNLAGGFGSSGPIGDSDPAVFEKMLSINARTAYLTTRAFFPALRSAGGSIVFFASEVVMDGVRTSGVSAYAAAKSAVMALMRSVADEGRDVGVRANAVAPAAIRTATNEASMGPRTRYVEREDVASLVAFLCSPASKSITGQVIRLR